MLSQVFGDFDMAEVLVALPQERAEGAEGQAEAEMIELIGPSNKGTRSRS